MLAESVVFFFSSYKIYLKLELYVRNDLSHNKVEGPNFRKLFDPMVDYGHAHT